MKTTYYIPYVSYSWVNYGEFKKGNVVAESGSGKRGFWFGHDEIRETKDYYYLIIAGSQTHRDSTFFASHVYKVEKKELKGVDLQALACSLRQLSNSEKGVLQTYNEEQFRAKLDI